ncbi:protein MTL1-like [Strongylocentrotus purpuratus]|uniref:Uncharacterized protein n=1 Tax=Strongylocentrotus purpuratus TaxID=7668 RepID=A0A7M7PU30_STRPU|nr:protein MTL1-like [Strongylocentrotus purpuratus]
METSFFTFGTTTSPSTPPITISVTSSSSTTSVKTSATKSETTSETTSAAITTAGTKSNDSTPKSTSSPNIFTSYLTFGTTPSPSIRPITTSPTSPSKTSAKTSATKSETTSETTSASIKTAETKSYDSTPKSTSSPIMDTSYLTFGTTTSNHTRKNIHPETETSTKNNSLTIMVIMITTLGCILIIAAIVIIVVLRLKQRRDRQQAERDAVEINDSIDDEVATDRKQDTSYRSFGRLSGIRQGELMNNVLCEFSDGIIQNSILRSRDDQSNTDLYTIPDKTGIINRVAKTEIVPVSSHSNSSINRHQHEQNEFKQEDQHKNIDMPILGTGEDDDRNIPIYAMPEKGPRSTRNTMNTSPGSVSREDDAKETRV